MKRPRLLLLTIFIACLSSCSLKQIVEDVFNPSKTNNYDVDPTTEITTDTSSNDYDKVIEEEVVETPNEFTGENITTITESGNYHFQGEVAPITIKKKLEVYLFFDGVTIQSDTGKAIDGKTETKVHIVLQNGSTNSVKTSVDKNALGVDGDLYLSGNGTLNIESSQKKGIKTDGDIYCHTRGDGAASALPIVSFT